MEPAEARDPLIGVTIGNYQIEAKLGAGGMGAVYLARHPLINKQVALKVLHAELSAEEDVVARFFNEARAVNDIKHPNIVDVIDFGVIPGHGQKLVYFIMEFLDGVSLATLLRSQTFLSVDRAFGIAWQIADALAASHVAGVIHCDLKPDNVMLIQRGRQRDFVKVLDFGIAKLTGGQQQTRTGVIMGTPAYMSPEQCEGRSNIDHRTDVYALGVLLYKMLTGQVPFRGAGYRQVLIQHMTRSPAPPSSIRGGISPYVEAVVMKALAKHPDARYAGMDELMKALDDPGGYVEDHGGLDGFAAGTLAPAAATPPGSGTAGTSGQLGPAPITDATTTVPERLHPAPPDAPGQTTTLSASAMESASRPRWSKSSWLAAGLVTMLGLTGGGLMLVQQSREQATSARQQEQVAGLGDTGREPVASQDDSSHAGARAAASPAPPQPTHEQPAPPQPTHEQPTPPQPTSENVAITITTKPKGAKVFVDDEARPRGKTPLTIELARNERVTITLRHRGQVRVQEIVPREPKRFVWTLVSGKSPGIPPDITLPPAP